MYQRSTKNQQWGGKMKANLDIRYMIMQHNLKNWEVAQMVGISDGRLSVWLRTPLSNERRKRVEKAIDELTQSIKQ